jgi:energy-converting hydrogenase Eha subunit B
LVISGSLTSGIAGFIYARFRIKYLRSGYAGAEGSISLTVFISVLITVIGVVTAVFLITISE